MTQQQSLGAIDTVLVANRGEIASRILRTVRDLGLRGIAVYSEVDREMPFVAQADESVQLQGESTQVYRDVAQLIGIAERTGAQAIHPGYGFLSEVADAAAAVEAAGLIWVGPRAETIELMGDKIRARNLAAEAGMPVLPGTADPVETLEEAKLAANEIGYPVIVKAAAGGGGMGMQIAGDASRFAGAFSAVRGFAERGLSSADVLIERYVERSRHIEVQVLGDGEGRAVILGDRDCSTQRRNQKLVEEAPAPCLDARVRKALHDSARVLAESIRYRSAGTIECLFDLDRNEFYFLEMNTRLQVEHGVTELVHGVDLVEQQLRVAAGLPLTAADTAPTGHAFEFRINAERLPDFMPSPGKITAMRVPEQDWVRMDIGFTAGNTVSPFYDSLIAKLLVVGSDRAQAVARARQALDAMAVDGLHSNLDFHRMLVRNSEFCGGVHDTTVTQLVLADATRS